MSVELRIQLGETLADQSAFDQAQGGEISDRHQPSRGKFRITSSKANEVSSLT